MSIADQKKALRSEMLQTRKAIPPDLRTEWDSAICEKILESQEFAGAQTVLFYMPYGSEVDIRPLIDRGLATGKKVLLPLCLEDGRLSLKKVHHLETQLCRGHYGILEPLDCLEEVPPDRVDFALIPGVCFDPKGFRIGYGMGYYDRLMDSFRKDCVKWAAAYSCQVLPLVPREAHDRPIDRVITETSQLPGKV